MQNENKKREHERESRAEYLKGCPVCEHCDPELEREIQAFAQLLFDIYLAKHSATQQSGSGVDIDNIH